MDQLPIDMQSNSFTFVDGLNNTYSSKATRSHVMTNAYREKKKKSQVRTRKNKSIVPKTWTFELHSSSSPPVQPISLPLSNTLSPELNSSSSLSATPPSESIADFSRSEEETVAELSSHPSVQPRTIISAGLIDHFSTLPVPRTPIIDEFVAACKSTPLKPSTSLTAVQTSVHLMTMV